METIALILIWIFIIALILLSTPSKCTIKKTEGFGNYFKQYCPSCGWRNTYDCTKCTNCGICTTKEGVSYCTPGDVNGPYFRNDCLSYTYGDPSYYAPDANTFSTVQVRDIYPYVRYSLRNPWRYSKWAKN